MQKNRQTVFTQQTTHSRRAISGGMIAVIFLGLVLVSTWTATRVFAASKSATGSAATTSPTPSPTVSPPTDQQTTDQIKELIQNKLTNSAGQVKSAIDDMTLKKRGFIGDVERVIEQTVTVKNAEESTVLTIDPSIVIVKDNKKATIDDIAVGDWVTALGYTDGQNFTLRRLEVSSATLMPQTYDTVIGTAQTVSKTSLSIMPKTQTQPITYQLTKTTHYEDEDGNLLKVTDLKKDTQYLVISVTDQDPKVATFIKSLSASASADLNP